MICLKCYQSETLKKSNTKPDKLYTNTCSPSRILNFLKMSSDKCVHNVIRALMRISVTLVLGRRLPFVNSMTKLGKTVR